MKFLERESRCFPGGLGLEPPADSGCGKQVDEDLLVFLDDRFISIKAQGTAS